MSQFSFWNIAVRSTLILACMHSEMISESCCEDPPACFYDSVSQFHNCLWLMFADDQINLESRWSCLFKMCYHLFCSHHTSVLDVHLPSFVLEFASTFSSIHRYCKCLYSQPCHLSDSLPHCHFLLNHSYLEQIFIYFIFILTFPLVEWNLRVSVRIKNFWWWTPTHTHTLVGGGGAAAAAPPPPTTKQSEKKD
jgi:hypothetical protein